MISEDDRDPKMAALLETWYAPRPSADAVAAILRRAQSSPQQHPEPRQAARPAFKLRPALAIAASLALLAAAIGARLHFTGSPQFSDPAVYAFGDGLDENALGLVYSDDVQSDTAMEIL